ncbi:conserved Plasmodium protein, unknown function [Plasmodium vinckei vinckei]|uniref:Thrombospondin-related protein 1 n=1 Tax=Plasmodium vinckei vinckei TaxID=54757 RepID=A0A449BQK4_PLAVN|nr:conserved Plasmodium protein, unknown function [Plasmodium vinckei vinckei]VEV55702.1 conserved Plasmodium protein, unknown function [Plasmodium vinckei vinckei]
MYRIIFFIISLLLLLVASLLVCDVKWIGPTLKKDNTNYTINNKQTKNIILTIFKKKKKNIYSYSYFGNLASCRIKSHNKKVHTFGAIFYKIFEFIYSIIKKGNKIIDKFGRSNCYATYFSKGNIFINEIKRKTKIMNGIKRKTRVMNDLVYGDDENNDIINLRNFKNNTNQYFTCFLDKAKENTNALNEIDKWVDPKTQSCYCHEEHAEPCSLADISELNPLYLYMNNEMCNARNNNNKNSEIFIALAEYNIIKCKHAENKNRNVPKNKNNDNNVYQHDPNDKLDNEEMYNYCKYGLKIWNDKNLYNYNNCSTVKSLDEKNKDICIEKCRDIQTRCSDKNIYFYSFDICKKYYEIGSYTRDIYINVFKYFDDNCTYFDPNNHGIVLCKHSKIKCNFSVWSEWSECTKSCLKNEFDTDPIQKRTRFLNKDMQYASKACSVYMSDDNNTMEVQVCADLPYCNDPNDSNKEATSKIKKGRYPDEERLLPFVISLDEINKANAIKELNNNDTDLMNENFVINKSEILANCVITDMKQYDNYIKYNEKNRSCSCPNNEPTCYFKDIYNSSTWKKQFEKLCKKNKNINVVTADFILINCNMLISLKKNEISINTYLAMTFDCRSPLFQYLFCSKTSDHNERNFIYMIVTIMLGSISAIYVVYLIFKEITKYKNMFFQFSEKNKLQQDKKDVQSEMTSEEDTVTDSLKSD